MGPMFLHTALRGACCCAGWPAFHRSSAHTSPLLHDVDLDGYREVLMADYNGEILVFK